MSLYSACRGLPRRFALILTPFLQHESLPFAAVLTEAKIAAAFAEADADFGQGDDDVYTPALTLWAFLSQMLFTGTARSCRAAVARVVVLMATLNQKCADDTGAYCRARAKLPVPVLRRLTTDVANGCEQRLPKDWLWKGRHVYLVDGLTVSMPDTLDNQSAFPQPSTQAAGVGFPLVRLVVLMSLATAMVKDMAMGPYAGKETGETALLRELFGCLVRGDIVLGDRYYCSYFMIALLQELGVDIVFRLHQRRDHEFRRGRWLGRGDYLVRWQKPERPEWMDEETYARMPASIQVRQIHVRVNEPNFRVESLIVITTLLDAETYTKEDIAELYHARWLVELDIRSIKSTMGMDVLRCLSPEMVRREMWVFLMAYNLIRQTILEAALQEECSPRQLSFTAALQKIGAAWQVLTLCEAKLSVYLIDRLLKDLGQHKVGDRPNRVEPRKVKRRPKPHALLTEPRAQARAKLCQGAAA